MTTFTPQYTTRRSAIFRRQSSQYLDNSVENYVFSTHPTRLRFYGRRMLIYNEMRQDSVLRSIIDGIKVPLMGAPFRITPGDSSTDSQKMAEFMGRALGMTDDTMLDISWDQHVEEMLHMVEFGFSMAEKVLGIYEDGEIGFSELNYLPPVRLEWSRPWIIQDGKISGVRQNASWGAVSRGKDGVIDYSRIIHMIYQYRDRQPDGESMLSAVWRDWKNRVELEEFEQIGVEHDTGGTPIVYPPQAIDQEHGEAILEDIENIRLGSRMGVVMPGPKQGTRMRDELIAESGWLLETYKGDTAASSAREIINSIDTRIYARTGMHFMRMIGHSGSGGSFALARTMVDFFSLYLHAIQRRATGIWQRFAVRQIYDLNRHKWPSAECPTLHWNPPGLQDISTTTQAFLELAGLGVLEPTDLDKEYFRSILTLPKEDEGAEKLELLHDLPEQNQNREGSPNRWRGNMASEPQSNNLVRDRPPNHGK